MVGVMEVTGEVVGLASSMNMGLFTCWEVEPGAPEVLPPLPRRVASSSRVGEGPGFFSTGPNREASITSSPSMVINGAMHCWSSLTAPHRTPGLAPDALVQACSTLARANVFSWQMTQKFCGSEAGRRKSCGQSPCREGGASHQPEVSCCASGNLKAVACHKA